MIQRKDFWMVVLLSLITCGIYFFYFIYKTTAELNQMAGEDGKTINPSMAILLMIVTCGVYIFWWYYQVGNRLKGLGDRNGVPVSEEGISYLIWWILGSFFCGLGSYIALYLLIKNFNQLIDRYNSSVNPPVSSPYANG